MSYKERGYNDQKRLTLKTLECPFGEIKEKFCEQFPQFQKHVQIKQIMHDNFEQDKKDVTYYRLTLPWHTVANTKMNSNQHYGLISL